jgi:hypothetical protein
VIVGAVAVIEDGKEVILGEQVVKTNETISSKLITIKNGWLIKRFISLSLVLLVRNLL